MSMLEKIKSLATRIRWRSIIALVLLLAVVAVIWGTIPGGYSVVGGVGIRAVANPSTIAPGGSSTMELELKNVNAKGDVTVTVKAETYDKNIYFEDSNSQAYGSASIGIGPQETRKLKMRVKTKPDILEGQYTLDFTVIPSGEDKGPQTRVSLTVAKGG